MLAKCANPNCSNTFRYLHEGRLYLVDSSWAITNRNGSVEGTTRRTPEYAWFCSSCCRHMAIRIDEEFGPIVVRKSESLQQKRFGLP